MTRSVLKALLVCALSTSVSGCGFHLRGHELSTSFDGAYVQAARGATIARELERSLGFAGVDVVSDRSMAEIAIDVISQDERRRSVSVTARARTAEYEITLVVRYRIVSLTPANPEEAAPEEKVLVKERSIQAVRSYRLDRANIVGSSEEQALLRGEMEQDLVQQILRSLDTATRNKQTAAN